MIGQPESNPLTRVIIALSGTGDPAEIIEFAGVLARAARAKLHGLLIEDAALYDLAELPFSVSVTPGHRKPNIPLTADGLEQEYAREERACRKLISTHAHRSEISWSFERRRAALPDVLMSAGGDELLLIQDGDAFARQGRSIQELRSAGGLAILHRGRIGKSGPVLALCSGAKECSHIVDLARELAAVTKKPLRILLTSSRAMAEEAAIDLTAAAGAFLEAQTTEQLAAVIASAEPSLIIANSSTWPLSDRSAAEELMRQSRCPLIMLRGKEPA